MKTLLIVAHGSRRESSNEEVQLLARRIREGGVLEFDDVRAAFLEIAAPSIPDALAACAADGAREIVVLPYFLAAGRHVATDIPDQVDPFARVHPHIRISVAPHLGASRLLPQAIAAVLVPA